MLLARGDPRDRRRARSLGEETLALARELRLARLATRAAKLARRAAD